MERDEQSPSPAAASGIAGALEKEALDVLKQLPADQREKLFAVVRDIQYSRHYQGPIPCPEDIALYNKHIPDGADRLMRMAEEQARHRREMEKLVVSSQQKQSERGQFFGLAIGVCGILLGAALAYVGHDWVGGVIAGTTVVSLVSTFVLGKKRQREDLDAKRRGAAAQ